VSWTGLIALLPVIVVAAASVISMSAAAFYRQRKTIFVLTLLGIGAAFLTLFVSYSAVPSSVTAALIIDGYALFYMGLILSASFVTAVFSYGYLEGREETPEEYFILLLLAALGSMVLVASSHFVSFFLGLEILSVSLYSLIAYLREGERGNEAGVKYLVLAAVSSSFLLFGMALVYSALGTMEFKEIAEKAAGTDIPFLLISGFALIIVGIGFKLAVVPFHMWTPDVYEGAPAPVTAFIATVSKGAMFALLLRYFSPDGVRHYYSLFALFSIIAVASMTVGNLLALLQNNVKRILAYSSIAHLGYLLVAFLSGGAFASTAIGYYLAAYFITTLGAFGVVTVTSGKDADADSLEHYRGMVWRRPWIAGSFIAMLLSLAGIPLTAGFMGKFYVIAAGAGSSLWLLLVSLAANSAIGLFYYLRVAAVLFSTRDEKDRSRHVPLSPADGLVMIVLTLMLIGLGVYPGPLINLLQTTVAGLM